MSNLAERIRERLEVVRKSAAAVSLEAGLGRSAVQDILSGNSNSPRLDTLEKLTRPLQCSIQFLVGGDAAEEEGLWVGPKVPSFRDLRHDPIKKDLESGVFRREPNLSFGRNVTPGGSGERPEYPVSDDPRLPGHQIDLYRMMDNALEGIGIRKNDILWGASTLDGQIDLFGGQVVILEHRLDAPDLAQWTARQVEEIDDGFLLVPRSDDDGFDTFRIGNATIGLEDFYRVEGGTVIIHATAAALYREIPVKRD